MSFINILLATGASLLFLALVFIPMEKAFPAKPGQRVFRPRWFLDLCYFLGQYLLWSSLVLKALNYVGIWFDENISLQFRNYIGEQPIWLQAIEVLILSDLLIYWGIAFNTNMIFSGGFIKFIIQLKRWIGSQHTGSTL